MYKRVGYPVVGTCVTPFYVVWWGGIRGVYVECGVVWYSGAPPEGGPVLRTFEYILNLY